MGFRLAMIRPVDMQGRYPNQAVMDPVWRAFEEKGLVVAMHTLPYNPAKDLPPVPAQSSQWTRSHFTHRVVSPGQIGLSRPQISAEMARLEARSARASRSPVRRQGDPREVAQAHLFLCSDEASFVNGQVIVVDSGWIMASGE